MRISSSVEHYRYASSFEELRKKLSSSKNVYDLDKSLAYWVLPSDRRLPQAFLGRSLREVLETPFDELAATPGVGQKKTKAFLKLLSRIAKRQPAAPDPAAHEERGGRGPSRLRRGENGFDPSAVSEETWHRWKETIRAAGVAHEILGRLAPTLQSLPSVIWQTPLEWYLDQSLSDIRRLKTYGEKRVRVVLEVMHGVYEITSKLNCAAHLTVRLMPTFVVQLDDWIRTTSAQPQQLTSQAVQDCLLTPLVRQIDVDCGTTVARILENRLPIRSASAPVNGLAKRMGVTRARVYQLLEEAQQALQIRWPDGCHRLQSLSRRVASIEPLPEGSQTLHASLDVLFPESSDGSPRLQTA